MRGGGASAPQPADAEVLHHVADSLATPDDSILHASATVTSAGEPPRHYELWSQGDTYRVIKGGHEGSFNGSSFSDYDAATNTISTSPANDMQAGRSHAPADYAAALRAFVQSGQARVAGTTTIRGVPAYELTVGGESSVPGSDGRGFEVLPPGSTAYVARGSYRPLVIDYGPYGRTVTYEAYEYLPATSANVSLLSVAAQHPGARVVSHP